MALSKTQIALNHLGAKHTTSPPVCDCDPDLVIPASYMIFFDWNEYKLPPKDVSTIAVAAEDDKRLSFGRIYITAFTDTTGLRSANEQLSLKRQLAVKDQLVADGVSVTKIILRPFGASSQIDGTILLVPTGSGVRIAANRRVEIVGDKPTLNNPPKNWHFLQFQGVSPLS